MDNVEYFKFPYHIEGSIFAAQHYLFNIISIKGLSLYSSSIGVYALEYDGYKTEFRLHSGLSKKSLHSYINSQIQRAITNGL